jgi:AraC-like DNA-binding protein
VAAEEDASLAAQDRWILDRPLNDQKLFRDDNLTLSRLAPRMGVPARTISGAVNRLARKMSRAINDHRIADACRLLRETDVPVMSAIFEAEFQTRSTFNREFRRVTSLSPTGRRKRNQVSGATV